MESRTFKNRYIVGKKPNIKYGFKKRWFFWNMEGFDALTKEMRVVHHKSMQDLPTPGSETCI